MGRADRQTRGSAGRRLTPLPGLRDKIVRLIEAGGPLSIAEYMALCLYDKADGYYMTRDPFGRSGDFITAPEISQMFGELIGIWLVSAWRALGRPERPMVAEIGPGRGTLIRDVVRTIGQIAPDLRAGADFRLIETSSRLRLAQATTLQGTWGHFEWHNDVDELPRAPLLIVGNELFDAIPIRQYVKAGRTWLERAVGLDAEGNLTFTARPGSPDPALVPPDAAAAPDGTIIEIAPVRTAIMDKIAERIATDGGAGLFTDYGYAQPAAGDSLQALVRHAYADPLVDPGSADITAHVDFAALVEVARVHGLETILSTQGDFLLGMGLLERAGQLGAKADQAVRKRLQDEVDRLAGSDGMGTLFKVLTLMQPDTALPAFTFAGSD